MAPTRRISFIAYDRIEVAIEAPPGTPKQTLFQRAVERAQNTQPTIHWLADPDSFTDDNEP